MFYLNIGWKRTALCCVQCLKVLFVFNILVVELINHLQLSRLIHFLPHTHSRQNLDYLNLNNGNYFLYLLSDGVCL